MKSKASWRESEREMERDTQRAFSKKQAQRNVNEGARARERKGESMWSCFCYRPEKSNTSTKARYLVSRSDQRRLEHSQRL